MKQNKQSNKSCCLTLFELFLLLTFTVVLIVGLVYHFGCEQPHVDIPYSLNEVFHSPEQAQLITKLERKTNQYVALWGSNQTGIFQFLEHYADLRSAKGNFVIVRRVENNFAQAALKIIRYTKEYIQSNIDIQSDLDQTQWIFIVKNGEIPLQEINNIVAQRPQDRIIVGVEDKPNLKNFKKIEYPPITIADIQKAIQQDFNISLKSAEILTNFYGSIPQIFKNLDITNYSNRKILGDYFRDFSQLTSKQLKTLKNLCKNGKAPYNGTQQLLEKVGVQVYKGVAYWNQRINRLNYQLAFETQCVDVVIPEQIKIKIEQEKQQQAYAEAFQQEEPKKSTGSTRNGRPHRHGSHKKHHKSGK